jgi:hypothetical protein
MAFGQPWPEVAEAAGAVDIAVLAALWTLMTIVQQKWWMLTVLMRQAWTGRLPVPHSLLLQLQQDYQFFDRQRREVLKQEQ